MWDGVAPVPVEESPKSRLYEAIVPSGSAEADASNATARSVGVAVNPAVGGLLGAGAVTVTCRVAVAVAPPSSVTVRTAVRVPLPA